MVYDSLIEKERRLGRVDFSLKWAPLRNNQFQSLTWGNEVLYSDNRYVVPFPVMAHSGRYVDRGMGPLLVPHVEIQPGLVGVVSCSTGSRTPRIRPIIPPVFSVYYLGDESLEPVTAGIHATPRIPMTCRAAWRITMSFRSVAVDHRCTLPRLATTLTFERNNTMKMKLYGSNSLSWHSPRWALTLPAEAAKIRIVTTLTDLADFAREVGKDHVEVRSLATGIEDTHGVPMKPSFVPMLNRADLLICVGFDCEHAFLPALLEASKNPGIQPGHRGISTARAISCQWMFRGSPTTPRAMCTPTVIRTTCSIRCWPRRRQGKSATPLLRSTPRMRPSLRKPRCLSRKA